MPFHFRILFFRSLQTLHPTPTWSQTQAFQKSCDVALVARGASSLFSLITAESSTQCPHSWRLPADLFLCLRCIKNIAGSGSLIRCSPHSEEAMPTLRPTLRPLDAERFVARMNSPWSCPSPPGTYSCESCDLVSHLGESLATFSSLGKN